jgi:hypothetical protein
VREQWDTNDAIDGFNRWWSTTPLTFIPLADD